MRKPMLTLGALLVTLLAPLALAGFRHTTRPGTVCGVPSRDYQYRQRSKPAMVLSTTALALARESQPDPDAPALKVFQLDRARIDIDNCSISRFSLLMRDNGEWVLSIRADERSSLPVEEDVALWPERHRYGHIRREQFAVMVRAYAAYQVDESDADSSTGKPVVATLGPVKFWVQRDEPFDLRTERVSAEVAKYYDQIDRVEVEFYYYLP